MKTLFLALLLLSTVSATFAQTNYNPTGRIDESQCVSMSISVSGSGDITATTSAAVNDPAVKPGVFTYGSVSWNSTTHKFSIPANTSAWFIYFDATLAPVHLTTSTSAAWEATGSCYCSREGGCTLSQGAPMCDKVDCTGGCYFQTGTTPALTGSGVMITGTTVTFNGTLYQ